VPRPPKAAAAPAATGVGVDPTVAAGGAPVVGGVPVAVGQERAEGIVRFLCLSLSFPVSSSLASSSAR